MRITYNAPVILTYTLVCTVITALDTSLFASTQANSPGGLSLMLFTVYPFSHPEMSLYDPLAYVRLFSHAMGHAGWEHLVGNFTFILLLGPILEEKYGSKMLLLMMFITALSTGILNALLFNNALLGASGIVFMLILLVSFTNSAKGKIPLTFILITFLFLGKEIYNALAPEENKISEFAHIMGGIFGGVFGYFINSGSSNTASKTPSTGNNLDITGLGS